MTNTKERATPGPWHNHSTNFGYGPRHVCGPKHADGGDYAPICIADTEANARLIAASPMLLEALQKASAALDVAIEMHDKAGCAGESCAYPYDLQKMTSVACKAAIRAVEGE